MYYFFYVYNKYIDVCNFDGKIVINNLNIIFFIFYILCIFFIYVYNDL